MDTQFWWFYDLITAAVFLGIIYLSARKGFSKMFVSALGCIFGVVIALAVNNSLAGFMYDNFIRSANVRDVSRIVYEYDFSGKVKNYMESLDYHLTVNQELLDEILKNERGLDINEELYKYANNINGIVVDDAESFNENMNAGFAKIFGDMLSAKLPKYALNSLDYKYGGFDNYDGLINVMVSDNESNTIAKYIVDNYIMESSMTVIKLASFAIILIVIMLIVKLFIMKMFEHSAIPTLGRAEHPVGGILGLADYAMVMLIVVSAVHFLIIVGGSQMILFNQDSVDKSYLFKYIYNLKILK